jgi:hypothetical protein
MSVKLKFVGFWDSSHLKVCEYYIFYYKIILGIVHHLKCI